MSSIDASAVSGGSATNTSSDPSSASEHEPASGGTAAASDAGVESDALQLTGDVDAALGTQPAGDPDGSAASGETSATAQTQDTETSETTAFDTETREPAGNTEQVACNDEHYWDGAEGECKAWSTCSEGTYVAAEGTAESDRVCNDCASQTFSTQDNVTECTACNTCGWLGLETACTKSRDTKCKDLDVTKQFGTTSNEEVQALAVDGDGQLWSGVVTRVSDYSWASLRKYASDGATSEVFPIDGSGYSDVVTALTLDAQGRVWVAGKASGAGFVSEYSSDGTIRRSHEVEETPTAMAFDRNDNLWIVGSTLGDLAGTNAGNGDVFVREYPSDGSAPVTYQFGTPSADEAKAIVVSSTGDVFVAGITYGALVGSSAGYSDIFLRSYPGNGSLPTTSQFGSSGVDNVSSLVADPLGNLWLAGQVSGDFEGENQALVKKYPFDGSTPTTYQFGTDASDDALALAVGPSGDVWVAGETDGALYASNTAGASDGFVRQFGAQPSLTRQFGADGWEGGTRLHRTAMATSGLLAERPAHYRVTTPAVPMHSSDR
jgi:hypothetical protein